mmetsp:Transcript_104131/g.269634  ORF Transcript_104131/g.269634 Transcript_104131/m.269634 type:complete len:207 (-) Transcript_104131:885-1505(-)
MVFNMASIPNAMYEHQGSAIQGVMWVISGRRKMSQSWPPKSDSKSESIVRPMSPNRSSSSCSSRSCPLSKASCLFSKTKCVTTKLAQYTNKSIRTRVQANAFNEVPIDTISVRNSRTCFSTRQSRINRTSRKMRTARSTARFCMIAEPTPPCMMTSNKLDITKKVSMRLKVHPLSRRKPRPCATMRSDNSIVNMMQKSTSATMNPG